jgi:outer membrane receptor protein involved in Fe transport
LLDARYAWTADGWTVALSGANLTDQKGYNYAFSCSTGALYPEPGRLIRLSVARQF